MLPAEVASLLRAARPLVLVTETVAVAADATPVFVDVAADVAAHLHHRTVWILAAQTHHHYTAIARKLGLNMNAAVERGDMVILDALTTVQALAQCARGLQHERTHADADRGGNGGNARQEEEGTTRLPPLDAPDAAEQILAVVRRVVGAATDRPWSIVLDDASVPLLYGWTPAALLGFLEACEDLVAGGKGMLVVRVAADDDLADEPLARVVRTLAHRAALRIQFRPLATGYSRDLDGEIAVIPWHGPAHVLHVKATEVGLRFTARGLARGVI